MRFAPIAALLCALVAPGARAYTRDRVVFVVQNRSTNPAAARDLAPLVQDLLAHKRYEVVRADELAAALEPDPTGRVREEAVKEAARAARADAVVTVTVELFLDAHERSKGPKASPAIAMAARMFSPDGRTLWRNSLAFIAEESTALNRTSVMRIGTRGRSGRSSGEGARGAGQVSAASSASELLLWTLPQGRPSPEEIEAMRRPAQLLAGPAAEPMKATRFDIAPDRLREIPSAAHFPLRLDRALNQRLDRTAPVATPAPSPPPGGKPK